MGPQRSRKNSKLTNARVLIATIRQLGGCPCTRCLIPTARLHNLGMSRDRQQRSTMARSHASRSHLVATARKFIYEKNYGIDSAAVESLLKPESWVPNSVSIIVHLPCYLHSPLVRTRCQTALVHSDSTCLLRLSSISCTSSN